MRCNRAHDSVRDARGQVVTFKIIVRVSFPVALHVTGAALEELHPLGTETFRLFRKFAQTVQQRFGIGIEIDEDQFEPFFGAHLLEREILGTEILFAFDFGCAD